MIRNIWVVLFIFCATAAIAFGWDRVVDFGDLEEVRTVAATEDGGLIAAGDIDETGPHIWIARLDPFGRLMWQKILRTQGHGYPIRVLQTRDGKFILLGTPQNFHWILKVDQFGKIIWQKRYKHGENDMFLSVAETSDAGLIVSGCVRCGGLKDQSAILMKLSSNGKVQWARIYDGKSFESADDVIQTRDGGYAFAGTTSIESQVIMFNIESWVVKTDARGKIQWQKAFGTPQYDYFNSIQQTADEGFIIGGTSHFFGDIIEPDLWLLKLNKEGSVEWQRAFDHNRRSEIRAEIKQTPDGGYVATPTFSGSYGQPLDMLLLRLNRNGSVRWQKSYGQQSANYGGLLELLPGGRYLLAGCTQCNHPLNSKSWFLTVDSKGNIPESCRIRVQETSTQQKFTSVVPYDTNRVSARIRVAKADASFILSDLEVRSHTNCSVPTP